MPSAHLAHLKWEGCGPTDGPRVLTEEASYLILCRVSISAQQQQQQQNYNLQSDRADRRHETNIGTNGEQKVSSIAQYMYISTIGRSNRGITGSNPVRLLTAEAHIL